MQEGVFKLNMFFFPFFDSFQTNIIKTVERVFSTHYSLFLKKKNLSFERYIIQHESSAAHNKNREYEKGRVVKKTAIFFSFSASF
jgi:hypothetical protein